MAKNSKKPLSKKAMKKTKGGILIGLKPPPLTLGPRIIPTINPIPPTPCI